jgi:hypothetical protein
MIAFTSLADAQHAGYEVIASNQSGYLVRLLRPNGAQSYGLVMRTPGSESARGAHIENACGFDSMAGERHMASGCSAKFALEFERGVPVVRVESAIDAYNIAAFKAVIECAEATGAPAIIVAIGVTECVCARAYGILSVLHTRLENVSRWLCVASDPCSYARRMMALLEVPFRVFDNVEDAIAAERRKTSAPLGGSSPRRSKASR